MIGDLTLDGKLTFIKGGAPFILGDLGLKIGVQGRFATSLKGQAITTDNTLDGGWVGTIGFVGVKNLNPPLVRTPLAPTIIPVGVTGSTTYAYKVVAKQADGGYTVASPAGTITNGFANLDNQHYNLISWKAVDDATAYDVYRTQGGGAHGQGCFMVGIPAATLVTYDNGIDASGLATGPLTTPFDFTILFGQDGTNYPIKVRGGEVIIVRWNAATIHFKAAMNPSDFVYLIVED